MIALAILSSITFHKQQVEFACVRSLLALILHCPICQYASSILSLCSSQQCFCCKCRICPPRRLRRSFFPKLLQFLLWRRPYERVCQVGRLRLLVSLSLLSTLVLHCDFFVYSNHLVCYSIHLVTRHSVPTAYESVKELVSHTDVV